MRTGLHRGAAVLVVAAGVAGGMTGAAAWAQPSGAAAAAVGVDKIAAEASAVAPLVTSAVAREFCAQAAKLPRVEGARKLYMGPGRKWYGEEAAAAMTEEERGKLRPVEIDEYRYYTTFYGSPLAFARALEVAATAGGEGGAALTTLEGKRVLDFGYGAVGHLRMMAQMGAEVTGVEVDEALTLIYDDVGTRVKVDGGGGKDGSVRLVHGRWPAEEGAREAVAEGAKVGGGEGGYDLIVSKNTLKNGYLNPEHPVDKRMLVDLGVSHEAFVKALHDALRPGGVVVIYNLSPKQNQDPAKYIPWADGRCPFPRGMLEGAGFEVLALDRNDDAAAREIGRALGWDQQGMDLEDGLFGHATVLRRPLK